MVGSISNLGCKMYSKEFMRFIISQEDSKNTKTQAKTTKNTIKYCPKKLAAILVTCTK